MLLLSAVIKSTWHDWLAFLSLVLIVQEKQVYNLVLRKWEEALSGQVLEPESQVCWFFASFSFCCIWIRSSCWSHISAFTTCG